MNEGRTTRLLTGGLLIAAGILVLIVPAENIWPWALGFWAVGLGLSLPAYIAGVQEMNRRIAAENARRSEVK